MKYIHVRHWDYWYCFYKIGQFENVVLDSVEFHITDQADSNTECFHLEFFNTSALKRMINENEYIDKGTSQHAKFTEKCNAMSSNEIDLFIGSLYYPHYDPDISTCNEILDEGKTIMELKSPTYKPNYADVFINENDELAPELLVEWTSKVYSALFCEHHEFLIAEMPTFEETLASYKTDGRF